MARTSVVAATAILIATLPGCQIWPNARPDAGADIAALVRYGNELRTFDATRSERDYRELVARAAASSDIDVRVRLALLLSDPDSTLHDHDRALRLLAELPPGSSPPGSAELAGLVAQLLRERTCVDTRNRPLAELLVAERDRNRSLDDELGTLRAALAAERAQRETLQDQLEALKSLEERLSTAAQGAPAAPER